MKKYLDVFVYSGFFTVVVLLSLLGGSSLTWHWHFLSISRMAITFACLMGGVALTSLPSFFITLAEKRKRG
jgi:hypothetical protein